MRYFWYTPDSGWIETSEEGYCLSLMVINSDIALGLGFGEGCIAVAIEVSHV